MKRSREPLSVCVAHIALPALSHLIVLTLPCVPCLVCTSHLQITWSLLVVLLLCEVSRV